MSGKIEISRELSESEFSAFWEQNKLDLLERKIGRSDCKAIWLEARKLAAPVVERQPVAWMDPHWNGKSAKFHFGPTKPGDVACPEFWKPLYTSPPVPVAVVLPDRNSAVDVFSTYGLGQCAGWNACLDKVKELNQ